MKKPISQFAIIGSTASGKSALALELAQSYGGIILSIDSLSIYKEIDIASAKPSKEELSLVPHYGIDILYPNESFDVMDFIKIYQEAYSIALKKRVSLILVGGSSFYLKSLINGISPIPTISKDREEELEYLMKDIKKAYQYLEEFAQDTAKGIKPQDRYRIEKALVILLETQMEPLEYFKLNPPISILKAPLEIFEIEMERSLLRERIELRTDMMLKEGLIDEVSYLERHYGRSSQAMRAIGIVEVLDYFDGVLTYQQMREKIIINTARLAKRQKTFNNSQFLDVKRGNKDEIKEMIRAKEFSSNVY